MNEKEIFSIPVYAYSAEEFKKRWKPLYDSLKRAEEQRGEKGATSLLYPNIIWRYNQIIGYITISLTHDDVLFNVYKCLKERIRYNSRQKNYIEDMKCVGLHFRAVDKSNEEIKQQMHEWLSSIIECHFSTSNYFDIIIFETLLPILDIKGLMDTL